MPTNQPLTKEAARKLMALDLTAKELTTYEKLDEWYTAWGGQCYVSFSGGKDSTVLAYLAARYLPEDATLGSLFDGIAGFPLIWERIHGKGTARWASEIEPFPIAVTKKWFGEE